MQMPGPPPADTERRRLLERLRRITPGAARSTDLLDDVIPAYGDVDLETVWRIVSSYTRAHADELRRLLDREAVDTRRPRILSDPAIMCVLERLDNDRYALRRAWAPRRDLAELRRLASLWGVRLGI
jgi:hypothetical protein